MNNGGRNNFAKEGTNHHEVTEQWNVDPLDAEQARRILREETPKRIERLRRELRELYFGERGRVCAGERQEHPV